jgi:hypothetical protein
MSKSEQHIRERNLLVHAWLLRAGHSATVAQFARVFSPDAPPIGWHIWHMARFADRLQAKLRQVTDGNVGGEVWENERTRDVWDARSERLGVFYTGMGQSHEDAQTIIAKVGKDAVLEYAQASFETCDSRIQALSDADFEKDYFGILDYAYDSTTGSVWATEPKTSAVAQDLVFHAAHGSRHMGMIEALKGLLGSAGTLSV